MLRFNKISIKAIKQLLIFSYAHFKIYDQILKKIDYHVNFYVVNEIETIKQLFIQNLAPFYESFNPFINSLKKR